MNPFKDALKDCDCKFTQLQSRGHIGITQNLFNEHLLAVGYKWPLEIKYVDPRFGKFFVDLFLLMMKL